MPRRFFCCSKKEPKIFPITPVINEQPLGLNSTPTQLTRINNHGLQQNESKNDKTTYFMIFPATSLNFKNDPSIDDIKQVLKDLFIGKNFFKSDIMKGYTSHGIERKNLYETSKEASAELEVLHKTFSYIEFNIPTVLADDPIIYPELKNVISIRDCTMKPRTDNNNKLITGESLLGINMLLDTPPEKNRTLTQNAY